MSKLKTLRINVKHKLIFGNNLSRPTKVYISTERVEDEPVAYLNIDFFTENT